MRIEDKLIDRIDSKRTPEASEAFKHATALIEKSRFKPAEFLGTYPPETIAEDIKRVQDIEHQQKMDGHMETEHDRVSAVFEALFHQHVEVSNWLGEGIVSYKTSKFDDYINHVDSVLGVEITSRGLTARSYIALGIDVTTSMHFLEKKFNRIFEEIRRKKFAEVKYFSTNPEEQPQFKGRLQNLLRLVVGADVSTVRTLSELWLKGSNKELSMHPIQYQIIDELILQCEVFQNYAGLINNTVASSFYGNMLAFLKTIRTEKTENATPGHETRDRMMQQMRDVLERCRQSALTK